MASEQSNKMSGLSFPVRIGLAALGLLVLFGLYSINRDRLSLEHLAERQEQIGALLKQYPVLLFAAGYLLYTAVTRISLPGAGQFRFHLGSNARFSALPFSLSRCR